MGMVSPSINHLKQEKGELLSPKIRTKLKEGYIVRYADDFKILCRD